MSAKIFILPEVLVTPDMPRNGLPGSLPDAGGGTSSGTSAATGGAAGVISRPTAQQQGLDVPHDSAWQQRSPHPTVDQRGNFYKASQIGHPDGPSADPTFPLNLDSKMNNQVRLRAILNWARKVITAPGNQSPAGTAGYWGAAYHESTDGSVPDMLDGPKMYTNRSYLRGSPDSSYKYYPMSPAFSVHPEDLSLDPTSTYWAADFTGADPNGRLLFDPTPVSPYGPPIPNLFDPPFQPSR